MIHQPHHNNRSIGDRPIINIGNETKNFLFSLIAAVMILSASVAFGQTTAYDAMILGDNPTSYWPLNETNGITIHDMVGTNNGTCVNPGGLTLGGPGILSEQGDKAIYFTN